jgi:Flp pilus assembly protein TadB
LRGRSTTALLLLLLLLPAPAAAAAGAAAGSSGSGRARSAMKGMKNTLVKNAMPTNHRPCKQRQQRKREALMEQSKRRAPRGGATHSALCRQHPGQLRARMRDTPDSAARPHLPFHLL